MRIGHPKWEMRHAGHEKVMFYYQLLPILVPFRGIFSPCEYLDFSYGVLEDTWESMKKIQCGALEDWASDIELWCPVDMQAKTTCLPSMG